MRWESDGGGEFTIEMAEKTARGTDITLHLRADQDDLLNGHKIRSIVHKYSDHIVQPIVMKKEEWKDGGQVVTDEDETVNQATALWARSKNEITDEQYKEFYKHVGHDYEDPLAWTHNARGRPPGIHPAAVSAGACAVRPVGPQRPPRHQALRAPRVHHGRRRAIAADLPALRARRRRFQRPAAERVARDPAGVARTSRRSAKAAPSSVLGLLEDLATNDKEKYARFWGEFGQVLKEGAAEDFANKEKIAGLLRFASTHADTDAADRFAGRLHRAG